MELWFEILVELNHFSVRLKSWLSILHCVTFFETSPTFPETHIFECTQIPVVPYTVKKLKNQWRCSGVFIVIFEHIQHLVLVFLLLTLNM